MKVNITVPPSRPPLSRWLTHPFRMAVDTIIRRSISHALSTANLPAHKTEALNALLASREYAHVSQLSQVSAGTGGGIFDSSRSTPAPFKALSPSIHNSALLSASGTAFNVLLSAHGDQLRNASRHYVRSNGWAKNGVRTWATSLVGTGIIPKPLHPRKEIRDKQRRYWDAFVRQVNWYGMCYTAAQSLAEDGEALFRFTPTRSTTSPVPLDVSLLPAEHLPFTLNQMESDSHGDIYSGIELNRYSKPAAYWLHPRNPTDYSSASISRSPDGNLPAPVAAKYIAHSYIADRSGQLRGIPLFSPVLFDLHQLTGYEDTETIRAKIASLVVFWLYEDAASGGAGSTLGAIGDEITQANYGTSAGTSIPAEGVTPGAVVELPTGKRAESNTPAMTIGYQQFTADHHRKIAAGAGILYEHMTGNYAGVTYSSMRSATLKFHEVMDCLQFHQQIPQVCNPAWSWVMRQGALAGVFDPEDYAANRIDYEAVDWMPPARRLTDPLKEVQAEALSVNNLFKPRGHVIRASGYNEEEIDEGIRQEQDREEKLKLVRRTKDGVDVKQDERIADKVRSAAAKSKAADGGSGGSGN